jgi:hypothetical protein
MKFLMFLQPQFFRKMSLKFLLFATFYASMDSNLKDNLPPYRVLQRIVLFVVISTTKFVRCLH